MRPALAFVTSFLLAASRTTSRCAGARWRRRVPGELRFLPCEPRTRFPRANSRGPRSDRAREHHGRAYQRSDVSTGSALTDGERRAVAAFLAGRPVGTPAPPSNAGTCTAKAPAVTTADLTNGWNGWGGAGAANTRFQSAEKGGITAPMIPRLKLKWAFGFPASAPRVRSRRSSAIGCSSAVRAATFALDAKTGCTHWTFHTKAGIRTAPSVGPYQRANGTTGFAVYVADGGANAYAVDTETGQEIWNRKMDDHVRQVDWIADRL